MRNRTPLALSAIFLVPASMAAADEPTWQPSADATEVAEEPTSLPTEVLVEASELIPNGRVISGHLVGGQPTAEGLAGLQEAGFDTVITLRLADEVSWDEGAAVAELGMNYVSIPVSGAEGMTFENAALLETALSNSTRAVVHCGSGNRVGGLFALRAFEAGEITVEAALVVGAEHGLTRLADAVRAALEAGAAD